MANQYASIAANLVGSLKPFFEGPIVSQFNDECPLYKAAAMGTEKFTGTKVVRPLKVRRNPGIGATSEGGNLPAIGRQTTIQAEISAKYNYLRAGLTAQIIAASANDRGAFVRQMSYEMEEGKNDLVQDVSRQSFFNGLGTVARLNAAAVATNVITVKGRTNGENGNKYVDVDWVIDIYNSAGTVLKASGILVTAISGTTTATLTLNANVTVAEDDIVVRNGALNNEIQGLLTVLDGASTSIFGVDRSTYTIFQGNTYDAANAQLTLNLIQQAVNGPRQRAGKAARAAWCDFDSERFYTKLLVADKRYIGEKVKGDGTFLDKDESFLSIAGVPLKPDKDCIGNSIFFGSPDGFKKYVLGQELQWADETGSVMIAQNGVDSFELRLRLWANFFYEKPSAWSRLYGYISP